MITYKFGDILLVPFPFTDQTTTKKRPSVVISYDTYNQLKPDLIIMAITSQINPDLSLGELEIIKFIEAGLLKPSIIKPVISTIDKSLVIRKLGKLLEVDCNNVRNIINTILG